MSNVIDHEFTDDPVCPNCGKKEVDAFEYEFQDGDEAESECSDCGAKYRVTCIIRVTYSTELIRKVD